MTQQDFIDKAVREFITDNINIIMDVKSDKK